MTELKHSLKTKKNHMNTAWILNTVIQPAKNPNGFEADRKENAPVGHFQGGAFMEAQLCTGHNKRGGKFRSVQSTSGRSSDKMKV